MHVGIDAGTARAVTAGECSDGREDMREGVVELLGTIHYQLLDLGSRTWECQIVTSLTRNARGGMHV